MGEMRDPARRAAPAESRKVSVKEYRERALKALEIIKASLLNIQTQVEATREYIQKKEIPFHDESSNSTEVEVKVDSLEGDPEILKQIADSLDKKTKAYIDDLERAIGEIHRINKILDTAQPEPGDAEEKPSGTI